VYGLFVGKPEGKKTPGRPRQRWVDNVQTDLRDIGFGVVDWIAVTQDVDKWRGLLYAIMKLRVL
jgi:hypothetical protein